MDFIQKFRDYIMDNTFEIRIYNNKIDVINYSKIDSIDTKQIIIRHINEVVLIKGDNLVISKLMNDEVLITGKILSIEFR